MASNIDDACKGEIDLPLIDLSVLNPSELHQADKSRIMRTSLVELISKIGAACQEPGIFHVINHGLDEEVFKRIDSAARDIFAVPNEVKEKSVSKNDSFDYLKRVEPSYVETVNLKKVLLSDSVQRISDLMWPEGNPKFCEAIQEFSAKMEPLSKTLMKLIVLSLGFDKSSEYYESFFEKSTESLLRLISYVPPTNRQSSAIVLPSHTDFSFLSILYHDNPAGLEVQNKEGDWLRVKPVASSTTAFIVNLGDAFEIWSNSRYLGTPHRVVDAGWSSRLTVPFFVACKDETELYAPEQLVDEEHPRRYVRLVFKDFKDYKFKLLKSIAQNEKANVSVSPFLVRSPPPIPLLT